MQPQQKKKTKKRTVAYCFISETFSSQKSKYWQNNIGCDGIKV